MPSPSRANLLFTACLAAFLLVACHPNCANGQATSATPLGEWQTGRSTFYDGIDGGNCGFETIPSTGFPYRNVAAANTAFYAKSAACGQCFEVKCTGSAYLAGACTGASVIVEVTDQCPCAGNEGYCCSSDVVHFDLSPSAFTKIANVDAGVIDTQYRPVACPVAGNMQVKIKDGSNPWWFALLATNVGGSGAVTKIELQSGSAWVRADRQDYNYWLTTSGSGLQFPLGVRVWQGTQNVTGTIAAPSGVFSLSSNFASGSTTEHDGGCFIPNKQ